MYNGQGGPAMLFYPPLTFYIVAFLDAFVGNTLQAFSLGCWLALALSGLTMYLFSRAIFSRRIALFVAAFYMIAPYHLFNLYQRSALAEFWSFAWLPLVLDAIRRGAVRQDRFVVPYVAISYALRSVTLKGVAF